MFEAIAETQQQHYRMLEEAAQNSQSDATALIQAVSQSAAQVKPLAYSHVCDKALKLQLG